MFAKFNAANAADFKQRHESTIGWLHRAGKTHLVYVSHVGGDRVSFSDKDGTEYFATSAADDTEFEFLPVTRGWKNGTKRAWYMQRRPARQYQRGVSPNNTEIFSLSPAGALNKTGVEIQTVHEYTSKDKVDPFDLFHDSLNAKRPYGVAIDRHFALVPKGVVYFYDRLIGMNDGNKITIDYPAIRQELGDVLRRKNIPLTIA